MDPKKMNRRGFLTMTAVLGAGAALAACAPKEAAPAEEKEAAPAKPEEEAKPAPKEAEEIHFLCRPDIKPAYAATEAVETWNENFESQVSLDEPPSGTPVDIKIQASQAAGDLIWDGYYVMVMPHDTVNWVSRELIQPFDPFIEASTIPDADKVIPSVIPSIKESVSYEGKVWGMPGNVGSIGLAWAWEPLRAIGLDGQPYTWQGVYEAAKEIKKAKPDLVPMGFACTPLCDLWSMIWSAQDDPIDENGIYDIRGEASIAALKWMRQMVEEDLLYTTPNTGLDQWLKGGWAMICSYDVAGTMAQQTFGMDKYESGINFFPESKDETHAGSPFWINCGVVLNKANNPQGFTDFCLWWFGPDNKATGKQITEVAAKPCYTYTYEDFVEDNPQQAWQKEAIDLCAKSVPFPKGTTHSIQGGQGGPHVQKVYDTSLDFAPEKWMDEAYQDIQDEIAKQKSEQK